MPAHRIIRLSSTQWEFIHSEAPFPAFGGGWGCGKTLAGCVAVYKRASETPNSRWLIGRLNFTALRDTTLQDWLDLFATKGHYDKSSHTFTLQNGSQVMFRHLDNYRQLTNANLSGFWIDQAEEVPEEAFTYLRGRGRRLGAERRQGFLTFNMEGHNWIWRLWKQEKTKLPGTDLWEATTWENRDNLPADFLKQLETLPSLARKRYVEASWDAFEGQVFDEFDERVHVIDPFAIPPEWFRFEGIDHGYTNPTSVHWYAVDPDDNMYSYDEHYQSKTLIPQHAEAILAHRRHSDFGGDNQTIQATYIDPSARSENQEYKGQLTSILKLYLLHSKQQIAPIPAPNDKAAGINLIKQMLRVDPERLNPRTGQKGSPRLFLFRNCVNQIDEVRTYAWKRLRPQDEGHKNAPEEPVKVHDHSIDELKYVVLGHFGHPERIKSDKPANIGELVERDLEFQRTKEQQGSFESFIA